MSRNIRLILAYDGTDFHGWQRQPEAPSIQACVEGALHKLSGSPTTVCASGRTDAGVHATGQVANFQTASRIPCANLVKALNGLLPATVRVLSAEDVAAAFNARFDARRKTYRYRLLNTRVCSPLLGRFVYHYPYALDFTLMARAAKLLEGEHDFTSFAATDEDDESKCRVRLISCSRMLLRPRSSLLIYEVTGTGFLRYMVRNIVGTLIEVGRGKLAPAEIPLILAACDRTHAGPTAPAQGLCLMRVEY